MESICTAETAEDAEIALTWLSANSAVSAVHPASAPVIHWKKGAEIFHRKSAHFITAVIDYSQWPNQTSQRNAHRWGLRRRQDFDFMIELIINPQPSGRG